MGSGGWVGIRVAVVDLRNPDSRYASLSNGTNRDPDAQQGGYHNGARECPAHPDAHSSVQFSPIGLVPGRARILRS